MFENGSDDLFRLVDDLDQIHIVGPDHLLFQQAGLEPLHQAAPELAADEDHRHAARFAGLHQRQRFHQLVHGAETARHHDVSAGKLHEHHLAREEMVEGLADVLVRVIVLLVRQLDVQADAGRLAVKSALVGRFHDAGTAAGNDRKSGVRQKSRDLFGKLVIGMVVGRACAAEDADRRVDVAQAFGRRHEF